MRTKPLNTAVVVAGRFHAFDLAQALREAGSDVTVVTNYPSWYLRRYGFPAGKVRSFWFHGVLQRLAVALMPLLGLSYPEAFFCRMFGRWAARELKKEPWDVIHCWSGSSEEILDEFRGGACVRVLTRASAHIRVQCEIMEAEERRLPPASGRIDKPSDWIVAREEREYEKADFVRVISSFALQSFTGQGISRHKLWLNPLGCYAVSSTLSAESLEQRCRRILAGEALRILFVGAASFRKGIVDLCRIAESLRGQPFQFRMVGPADPACRKYLSEFGANIQLSPKVSQEELKRVYEWGDIFLFPTVEDGFAVVLTQAQSAGLPILATDHSGAPDLVQEGRSGWVLPVRSPEAFTQRLLWCLGHRQELASMVRFIMRDFKMRSWREAAEELISLYPAQSPRKEAAL